MTAIRKAGALGSGTLALGLLALASTGWSAPRAPQDAPQGQLDSIRSIDEAFRERHEQLERQRIDALARLAGSQSGEEAEQTYRYLLSAAIVGGRVDAAEKAAEQYLARDDSKPETLALAALVDAMAAVERDQAGEAVAILQKFLGSRGEGQISSEILYSLGETFLQRLQADGKDDEARRIASLFAEGPFEDEVKGHFARRLERLEMVGRPAPKIDARDIDGEPVRLADLQGKAVLVVFWATWCPPCLGQIPELKDLYRRYKGDGLEIVGVSVDALRENVSADRAASSVRAALIDLLVPWPTVLDASGENNLASAFGVTEIPASFLIDQEGKIVRVDLSTQALDRAVADLLGVEPAPEAAGTDPAAKPAASSQPTEPVKGPARNPTPKGPRR